MLEVMDSKLTKYIVHYVSETVVFGDEAFPQPEVMLEAAFTQLAFHKIDFEQTTILKPSSKVPNLLKKS